MKLTGKGMAVAAALWLLILVFASGEAACLRSRCDRSDLVLAAVIGAAMLVPAYIGVLFLGAIFKSLLVDK